MCRLRPCSCICHSTNVHMVLETQPQLSRWPEPDCCGFSSINDPCLGVLHWYYRRSRNLRRIFGWINMPSRWGLCYQTYWKDWRLSLCLLTSTLFRSFRIEHQYWPSRQRDHLGLRLWSDRGGLLWQIYRRDACCSSLQACMERKFHYRCIDEL